MAHPLIVQNAGNTCYIDSLLISIFFEKSFDKLLITDPKITNAIYLQEFIKIQFVDCIRQDKSVLEDTINTMRQLLYENGWKKDETEIFSQQDVTEFYTFLVDIFNGPLIETRRTTISEGLPDIGDNGIIEKLPFIPLSLPDNFTEVKIRDLLDSWLNDNVSSLKRKIYKNGNRPNDTVEDNVNALNIYNIENVPYMVGLSINRFKDIYKRDQTDIIIQRKINPSNSVSYPFQHSWVFHAAICHIGDSPKNGHYYCIVEKEKVFYLFDDLQIPSVVKIDMSEPAITSQIKKNVVFILYRLEN